MPTLEEIKTALEGVRDETTAGANTATVVGSPLVDLADQTISIRDSASFNVDHTDHTTDFSVLWGYSYASVNNTSSAITITLPHADSSDIGKEIKLWIKADTFLNNVDLTTSRSADSINDIDSIGASFPIASLTKAHDPYLRVTVQCMGQNDIHITNIDNISVPSGGGGVATASLQLSGAAIGATDGNYTATQVTSTGSGTGASFTLTVSGNLVTNIVSIDTAGSNYEAGDDIEVAVLSDGTWFTDPVINVDSVV